MAALNVVKEVAKYVCESEPASHFYDRECNNWFRDSFGFWLHKSLNCGCNKIFATTNPPSLQPFSNKVYFFFLN